MLTPAHLFPFKNVTRDAGLFRPSFTTPPPFRHAQFFEFGSVTLEMFSDPPLHSSPPLPRVT